MTDPRGGNAAGSGHWNHSGPRICIGRHRWLIVISKRSKLGGLAIRITVAGMSISVASLRLRMATNQMGRKSMDVYER